LTANMEITIPTLILYMQEVAKLEHPPAVFVGGRALGLAGQEGPDAPVAQDCEGVVDIVTGLLEAPNRTPAISRVAAPGVPPRDALAAAVKPEAADVVASAFSVAAVAAADTAREAARNAFRFEALAYRDGLTGLWNRRAYDDRVADLSSESDGSALMLDVDEFKSINDTYGHEAGDQTLVAVGRTILESIRPIDFGARFGGDEFAVLLPGMSTQEATTVAERIREAIEAKSHDPPVTVSVGVAGLTDDSRRTTLSVDQALYSAKRAGRNRVVSSDC
jgi:diguanylate cyclase (GGDEF)-like protein